MAERLVILSDMLGSKSGLWITSYLGYLQQYYDIVYYDSQQLANIDVPIKTLKNIGYVIDNCSSRMLNFSGTTEKHPEV